MEEEPTVSCRGLTAEDIYKEVAWLTVLPEITVGAAERVWDEYVSDSEAEIFQGDNRTP